MMNDREIVYTKQRRGEYTYYEAHLATSPRVSVTNEEARNLDEAEVRYHLRQELYRRIYSDIEEALLRIADDQEPARIKRALVVLADALKVSLPAGGQFREVTPYGNA